MKTSSIVIVACLIVSSFVQQWTARAQATSTTSDTEITKAADASQRRTSLHRSRDGEAEVTDNSLREETSLFATTIVLNQSIEFWNAPTFDDIEHDVVEVAGITLELTPMPEFDENGNVKRHAKGGFLTIEAPISFTADFSGTLECSNGQSLIRNHNFDYRDVHVVANGTNPVLELCPEGWYMWKMRVTSSLKLE